MKEKKQDDLRVIKTKNNIRAVFEDLLTKKPIEKITVTELAELALINKGTFYHHYNDIYALYIETLQHYIKEFCDKIDFYEDFFTQPEEFVRKYLDYAEQHDIKIKFPYFSPDMMRFPIPVKITEELARHLFATKRIPHSIENEIRVECAVSNIFTSHFRYGKTYPQELLWVLGENIRSLFPTIQG